MLKRMRVRTQPRNKPYRAPHLDTWLSLEVVLALESVAEELGVSEVARSERGFVRAYEQAKGDPEVLKHMLVPGKNISWWEERNGFVNRHAKQMELGRENLWKDSTDGFPDPERRHSALTMWAYSPDMKGIAQWMKENA